MRRLAAKAVRFTRWRPSRIGLMRAILRTAKRSDLVRLGSDLGGWWVPQPAVRPGAVAYCAGAGEDITFDLALLAKGCRVVTFDPTPRAIEHVQKSAPGDGSFRFVPIGWWDEETELRFYAPRDPSHVSHSILNLQRTSDYFVAPVQPPWMLMRDLGDEVVDIIKMDIEGAEYRVLRSMVANGPTPTVLCVEFDQPQPLAKTLLAVHRLRAAGYSLAHIERWNYTFVRKR